MPKRKGTRGKTQGRARKTAVEGLALVRSVKYRDAVADALKTYAPTSRIGEWRPSAQYVIDLCALWYERGRFDGRPRV